MNLTKCSNGHFYDADKFQSCPHCGGGAGASVIGDSVTVNMSQSSQNDMVTESRSAAEPVGTMAPRPAYTPTAQEDDMKTISFYKTSMGTEPVVGWLVCLSGECSGQSYQLKSGRNFVGRSASMDIILDKDASVSRERHAVIIYEPKERIFIAQPGESRELFYLNDKVVLSNEIIKANDVFFIGSTKLMFIPFCSKVFSWEDL